MTPYAPDHCCRHVNHNCHHVDPHCYQVDPNCYQVDHHCYQVDHHCHRVDHCCHQIDHNCHQVDPHCNAMQCYQVDHHCHHVDHLIQPPPVGELGGQLADDQPEEDEQHPSHLRCHTILKFLNKIHNENVSESQLVLKIMQLIVEYCLPKVMPVLRIV